MKFMLCVEKVGIKRRIVHHSQMKRFHEAPTLEMANVNVDENKDGSEEVGYAAIVVDDGPVLPIQDEGEVQENNNAEDQPEQLGQPEDNQINERPQRERRPPDWFVDYQMNF